MHNTLIILYIILGTAGIICQGVFPFHWHGLLWRGSPENNDRKRVSMKEMRETHSFLWMVNQYWLNFFLSLVGWVTGYYLLFDRGVFQGNIALLIAAFVVAVSGVTGYLPNFIVNRLSSMF